MNTFICSLFLNVNTNHKALDLKRAFLKKSLILCVLKNSVSNYLMRYINVVYQLVLTFWYITSKQGFSINLWISTLIDTKICFNWRLLKHPKKFTNCHNETSSWQNRKYTDNNLITHGLQEITEGSTKQKTSRKNFLMTFIVSFKKVLNQFSCVCSVPWNVFPVFV